MEFLSHPTNLTGTSAGQMRYGRPGACMLLPPSVRGRAAGVCSRATSDVPVEQLSVVEEYNRNMAERMGWSQLDNPYEYRPERGEISFESKVPQRPG